LQQQVVVVGAGIAGLSLALALGQRGSYRITLLERDPQQERVSPEEAFFFWKRRGVAQFRQSHIFHPRLLRLYRSEPILLEEILRAGARPLSLREALPARLAASYEPVVGDEELSLLLSRRATLEAVIRRHVTNLLAVDILPSTNACGVVLDRSSDVPRILGVQAKHGDQTVEIRGDVVVDASGRLTKFPQWFRARGIEAKEETNEEVARAYYTRYYRLRENCFEPTEFPRPTFGNLEYLSYSVYPADNRYFSITFTFDIRDLVLRRELAEPEQFHLACEMIPQIARWVESDRAEATTDVLAMGRFRNYWRSYVAAGKPLVYGFFAIGDSLAHTNPAYGAGCSWAAEHAYMLASILERTLDAADRALLFDQRVRKEAYPFYSYMAANDRAIHHNQAISESFRRSGWGLRRKLRTTVTKALEAAKAEDVMVFRWTVRHKYMVGFPRYWLDRLALLVALLLFWAGGSRYRAEARPDRSLTRSEFLSAISGSNRRVRAARSGATIS
jgi:2-polyprenyl-6-methoxyphenol hydroxylase-like FAD-dependent oxidoreductase